MRESRAKLSFLPSGLSPSAPEYGLWAFTGSTSGLAPERLAGSPKKTPSPGSPPVREFHPPPKVTQEAIPQGERSHKERSEHFSLSARRLAGDLSAFQQGSVVHYSAAPDKASAVKLSREALSG